MPFGLTNFTEIPEARVYQHCSTSELIEIIKNSQATAGGSDTELVKKINQELEVRSIKQADDEDSIISSFKKHGNAPTTKQKKPKNEETVYVVYQDRTDRRPTLLGLFTNKNKAIAACRKENHYYVAVGLAVLVSTKAIRVFPKVKKKLARKG